MIYDIIVVTPFYKRENIFKIFLKHLKKNKEDGINLHAILIGSNSIENEKEIVESYGFEYVYFKNKPLSNKWNYGVSLLKKYDFKYLVVLGSDDIISTNLLNRLIKIMDNNNYDVCGLKDIYFYDINDNIGVHWTGYNEKSGRLGETVGSGRFYTKKLIEYLNYKLWDDNKNNGLDINIFNKIKNIKKFNIYTTQIINNEYLIDIKGGDEQITSFRYFKNFNKIDNLNIQIKKII